MAKMVVSRNQQAEMERLHPKPAYSRIVSTGVCVVAAGPENFARTILLGQNVWLLHVWVQHFPRASSILDGTAFTIVAGTGDMCVVGDLDNQEVILTGPVIVPGAPVGILLYDGIHTRDWSMKRFFEGQMRRFAIRALRFGAGDDILQVQFEVSEG